MNSKYVALHPAVPPIAPSRGALKRFAFILFFAGPMGRFILRRWINKVEIVGQEHLSAGSQLVLMNHSCQLDPLLLVFFGRKFLSFLVTEPFMAKRKTSRFAAWMGQISKRKLDADTRALRTLKGWVQCGGSVATFPEGQFSWDGLPLPLMPGIKELVNYLNVPVVIVRLINADRLWPAWASRPRKTSLRFEVEAPKVFAPGEDVERYVSEHLRVDPLSCLRWPTQGDRLAEGAARFLRFCFQCGADGSLRDAVDFLECTSCQNRWRVTGENKIGELTVAEVWGRVKTNLLKSWSEQSPYCEGRGGVSVMDASKPQWTSIHEGKLSLNNSVLKVGDWQIELKELLAHTMDWGDLILLRTERKRIALRMPEDSRAVWSFVLDEAIKKSRSNAI